MRTCSVGGAAMPGFSLSSDNLDAFQGACSTWRARIGGIELVPTVAVDAVWPLAGTSGIRPPPS